jgi:very-short-patch-repair endonuclease
MINKFLTKSNKLNANVTRNVTEQELERLRIEAKTTSCDLSTTLYCIYNNVSCKTCETCNKELNVENFNVGWTKNKQYCSNKCRGVYDPFKRVSNDKIEDYSILLDKNGNPAREKLVQYVNHTTIQDLQNRTNLKTDDFNTLLYAHLNKGSFVLKFCDTCWCELKISSFQRGYRDNQTTCSYDCKDTNTVYKRALSNTKTGVSRWDSEKYVENRLVPWFQSKKEEILNNYHVILESTFEEYKENKKKLNFRCIDETCGFKFVNDMSCGRSLFCKICNPKSKQQTELTKFCIGLGFDVEVDTRQIITPKEIDIYIKELNIGIEFDGFYWHDDKDDTTKTKLAKEHGVRLIRVFEDEYKHKKEIVLSRLSSILGKSENKIYARNCTIKEIDSETSRKFLESNHIQGNVNASVKYGLFHEEILVAVMTFSRPRYDKTSEWELIRFASILNTNVVGGASKLFSHFKKIVNPKSIVSYCDLRYGTGVVYEKLGFTFSHQTNSNYFYYKGGMRHSRVKFQKHKLEGLLEYFDPLKSETENMSNNGYLKIHDSGNLVFRYVS